MGQEIVAESFQESQFIEFRQRLIEETEMLRRWFLEDAFCTDRLQCGLELEAWLINCDGTPIPDNGRFLAAVDSPYVVPELSKFNFEINVEPQYIDGNGLGLMRRELTERWQTCEAVAASLDHQIVSIGTLPTITDNMLCIENMSSLRRYAALNEQVLRLRKGRPILLRIDGEDSLETSHLDLMLEAAATSVQVHLKVPPRLACRYYNASIIASAFTTALAANAPFLFAKRLWDDTRIAVFEQAVDTCGPEPRVTFGNGYVRDSLFEIFSHNAAVHRVLLPVVQADTSERVPHVRMHNGTIWHWNRPLIGFEPNGQPHLRIEHRPMSASPTANDLVADMMFYLGLVHVLATDSEPPESRLSIENARANFYHAAKHSLATTVRWLDGQPHLISTLLTDIVLPMAIRGMTELEIENRMISDTRTILTERLRTKQTGAAWQRRHFAKSGGDLTRLLQDYVRCQATGDPIHSWLVG